MVDWKGQERAEHVYQWVMLGFLAVGLAYGYAHEDFALACKAVLVGTGVALLLVVPEWPFLNRHPLTWLEPPPEKKKKEGEGEGSKAE